MSEADHAEVVSMLTGYERFIRLCIERHVSTNEEPTVSSAPISASFVSEKSPKLFGARHKVNIMLLRT